jgi:hypothetical protein
VGRIGAWTTGLTHTAGAGNNRLLVFFVGYENTTDVAVSAVTYGGQNLTRAAGVLVGTTTLARAELWILPETGLVVATDTTLVVTYGDATPAEVHYAAATFRNVRQTGLILDSEVASTNDATPNPIQTTVDVSADGMAVAAVVCGNAGSYTWDNGWTEGTDQSVASSNSASADHANSTGGTDTASATHTGPNHQAIVALSLAPVGAP